MCRPSIHKFQNKNVQRVSDLFGRLAGIFTILMCKLMCKHILQSSPSPIQHDIILGSIQILRKAAALFGVRMKIVEHSSSFFFGGRRYILWGVKPIQ